MPHRGFLERFAEVLHRRGVFVLPKLPHHAVVAELQAEVERWKRLNQCARFISDRLKARIDELEAKTRYLDTATVELARLWQIVERIANEAPDAAAPGQKAARDALARRQRGEL